MSLDFFQKIPNKASVPIATIGTLLIPVAASAHEVYVLGEDTISHDMATVSPNPFIAYFGNEHAFFFWGVVSAITLLTIFFASIFHVLERTLNPFFFWLKRFAHPLVRLTFGASLVACGVYGGLFGPEIPFSAVFGVTAPFMQIFFVGAGILGIAGLFTRYVAGAMIFVYLYAALMMGAYILTYANYFGEFGLLAILGSGRWSLDSILNSHTSKTLQYFAHRFEHLAFPLMRILFGFSIIFAAIYAKFIHSQLALDVVTEYHLTDYFHFEPLFIVLGALIIETLAGLMMVLGIGIRWTGLFLLFWLTLSLLYFGESVWPHLILFGLGLALFFHGYDRYSLEGQFLKRRKIEPVL